MICHICKSKCRNIFNKQVLNKYDVTYYKCLNCGFLQTEYPFWLKEAYLNKNNIAIDVGAVQRNLVLSNLTQNFIDKYFKGNNKFIDYGGGTGLFVRLMRDKGYDFYWHDIYSENIFARFFEVSSLPDNGKKFTMLTAFEVFEHIVNPLKEIHTMFEYTDTIFLTTALQPTKNDINNWWYLVPEGGQHINFYTIKAFEKIANHFNATYYTDGFQYHLISKTKYPIDSNALYNHLIPNRRKSFIKKLFKRAFPKQYPETKEKSLINSDFEYIKSEIIKYNRKT